MRAGSVSKLKSKMLKVGSGGVKNSLRIASWMSVEKAEFGVAVVDVPSFHWRQPAAPMPASHAHGTYSAWPAELTGPAKPFFSAATWSADRHVAPFAPLQC